MNNNILLLPLESLKCLKWFLKSSSAFSFLEENSAEKGKDGEKRHLQCCGECKESLKKMNLMNFFC